MKNMISIKIFDRCLDLLRKHDITKAEWAEATWGKKSYQSRISELIKLSENTKQGKGALKTGRAFNFKKCRELMNGLRKLLGGATLAKDILELLKDAETEREATIIMALAVSGKELPNINMFLKAILEKQSHSEAG